MPTYEFRCPDGHVFEKFYRTISGAASEAACPVCGKTGERMMSAAGFAFKGSGFYLTDYGKNAHRGKDGGEKSGAAPATSGSDSAKSDSSAASAAAPAASTASDAPKAEKAEKKPEPKAEA